VDDLYFIFLGLVWGEADAIVAEIKNGAYGSQKWCSEDPDFRITIKFVSWSPWKEIGPTIARTGRIGAIIPRILKRKFEQINLWCDFK